jgi:mRNA interferase RelE/StbE
MRFTVDYSEEAQEDLEKLDNSQRKIIRKLVDRVSQNPLPKNEGGYGEALGKKRGRDLTGFCKIKLLKLGIRVVYKIIREGNTMRIIVIAARADDEVYDIAFERKSKN